MCAAELLDSLGRRNIRKLADRTCLYCGRVYRPRATKVRYCSLSCSGRAHPPQRHSGVDQPITWRLSRDGYLVGRMWRDGKSVTVYQHRLVMEEQLGRRLLDTQVVHHINHDRQDNRPENLEVQGRAAHAAYHATTHSMAWTKGRQLKLSDAERARRAEAVRARCLGRPSWRTGTAVWAEAPCCVCGQTIRRPAHRLHNDAPEHRHVVCSRRCGGRLVHCAALCRCARAVWEAEQRAEAGELATQSQRREQAQ